MRFLEGAQRFNIERFADSRLYNPIIGKLAGVLGHQCARCTPQENSFWLLFHVLESHRVLELLLAEFVLGL